MKDLLFLLMGLILGKVLTAQTFSEWFEQNSTQLQYLRDQIAALQGYVQALRDGYDISREGLQSIEWIQQADVELHTAHFDYLEQASPGVQNDPCIAGISVYLGDLPLIADAIAATGKLLPKEWDSWSGLARYFAARIRDAVEEKEQLLAEVLGEGSLQMSDAERRKIIVDMYENVRKQTEIARMLLAELRIYTIRTGQ